MRVAAGDLNQNIPVQSNDEIGRLSETFNFMVAKLRETRSLEERLREAEHLSGLGQLSRTMAHEIRNPLNFISLGVDHLREKYRPAGTENMDRFEHLISGIKQEIHRLNKLVNDFLDYSRPFKLNRRYLSFKVLLDDVLALIWAKAEADGINIIRESPLDVQLYLDPDLFKSCILNVITNAFHAMSASGRAGLLRITEEIVEDTLVLTICDNGKGVKPEDLDKDI